MWLLCRGRDRWAMPFRVIMSDDAPDNAMGAVEIRPNRPLGDDSLRSNTRAATASSCLSAYQFPTTDFLQQNPPSATFTGGRESVSRANLKGNCMASGPFILKTHLRSSRRKLKGPACGVDPSVLWPPQTQVATRQWSEAFGHRATHPAMPASQPTL